MHRPKFLNGALIVLGLALLQGSATAVSPQWARGLDRAALTQNRAVPFQGLSGGPIVPVVGDELLLRVDSSVARDRIAELLDEYGLRPKRFFGAEGWVHVDLPAIETIRSAAHVRFGESSEDLSGLADAIRLIRSDLRFADVAPNALFRASRKPMGFGDPDSSDTVTPVGDDPDSNNFVPIDDDDDFDDDDPPDSPSDPLRSTQWNLDLLFSTGFTGTPWATAARVAILDSGIAYETESEGEVEFVIHPDLVDAEIETPWDFVDNDEDAYDEFQHGTHIASIIASQSLNDEGIAGITGSIEIMPVRVLDENGVGSLANLVAGIEYAVANGADVINMSLAFPPGYVPASVLQQAVEDAWDEGVIMVAAAGNEGVPAVSYPAVYNEVIAVGAVDPTASRAAFSNYGIGLDLVAPGGTMEDLDNNGQSDGVVAGAIDYQAPSSPGYFLGIGTSQATAHVSAVCAYVHAMTGRSALDIRVALESTATSSGWSLELGSGMPQSLAAQMWLSFNQGFNTGLDSLPGYVEDYGELPRLLPEGTFGVLMAVQTNLYLVLETVEGTFGFSATIAQDVGIGDIESDSLLDIATHPSGGAEGLISTYGGVPGYIGANGGIDDIFEYARGLPGFLDPTGVLLDILEENGAPLLFVDPEGTVVAEIIANGGLLGLMNNNGGLIGLMNNNGGLLGLMNNNGGLIGHMNNNGQLDAMSGTNGESLPPLETTGSTRLIQIGS